MKCLLPVLINRHNDAALLSGGERLTQSLLAEKTKIAKSTIGRLFNGTAQRYDANTVEVLCEFFGCGIGDLFTLVDDKAKAEG